MAATICELGLILSPPYPISARVWFLLEYSGCEKPLTNNVMFITKKNLLHWSFPQCTVLWSLLCSERTAAPCRVHWMNSFPQLSVCLDLVAVLKPSARYREGSIYAWMWETERQQSDRETGITTDRLNWPRGSFGKKLARVKNFILGNDFI